MSIDSESAAPPTGEWDPLTGQWTEPRSEARPKAAPSSAFSHRVSASRRRDAISMGVVGGIIGALAASLILVPIARRSGSTAVERRLPSATAPVGKTKSVVDIAATARPWVVNIDIKQRSETLGAVSGLGSGVVLRSDGHILTSAHVVRDATSIEVTLASGERLAATRVGIDDVTDVAVIKVRKQRLAAAVIGSARNVRVGDVAIAIGSPLGLEQTVTEGIISALGRTVRTQDRPLVEMIQTDAPITHGNSGGALINGEGAVIGINTAIGTTTGQSVGIGFATPIDVAVAIAHELIATGHATHPWLGVLGSNITLATAERFGVSEGALMVQVVRDGPGGRAGIQVNDVVVSFDKEPIKSMDELIVAIRNHKVGQRVPIEVVRNRRRLALSVTLEEMVRAQ